MRVLLITGSHPRHLYLFDYLRKFYTCSAIIMKREKFDQQPIKSFSKKDKNNFIKHFKDRKLLEFKYFGNKSFKKYKKISSVFISEKKDINSMKTKNFAKKFKPDICIVFGSSILDKKFVKILPNDTINIHLGLSPDYKGSATLFWPFYFIQPQFAGATFHKLTQKADSGDILHQVLPDLKFGDGIHDVAMKVTMKSFIHLKKLINLKKIKRWKYFKQTKNGKLFFSNDFSVRHLRVIYDLYQNKMVDLYLKKKIDNKKPKIIKFF